MEYDEWRWYYKTFNEKRERKRIEQMYGKFKMKIKECERVN